MSFSLFGLFVVVAVFIVAAFASFGRSRTWTSTDSHTRVRMPREHEEDALDLRDAHRANPLKILMFGWEFPPFNSGGLGVACQGITGALARGGAEVTFVVPKRLPVSLSYARLITTDLENVEVHAVDSGIHPYAASGSYAKHEDGTPVYGDGLVGEVARYARAAGRIASISSPDVIYAHDWLSFGAGMHAKRLTGKPLIAHVHATEFERSGGHSLNQHIFELEKEGLHFADRVIAVSERTKQIIMRHYGVPAEKIAVVHNGIDIHTALTPSTAPSRLTKLKENGTKIVLFMGRITLQKGPDYFVRAAKRVLEHDPKVLFVVAGSGDMERSTMELAASLGIGEHVLFTGFLRGQEQYETCALADLFVMPSVAEPFGLAALEAMRIGTPVLVSKQSGIAEAARHLLTADFWDTEEMANKMLFLLDSPELAQTLSRKAKRESSLLTWTRAGEKIRDLIDELAPPSYSYA